MGVSDRVVVVVVHVVVPRVLRAVSCEVTGIPPTEPFP